MSTTRTRPVTRSTTRASSKLLSGGCDGAAGLCPARACSTSKGRKPGTITPPGSGPSTTSIHPPRPPPFPAPSPCLPPPHPPPATRLRGKRQSANGHKARQQLGRAHLTLRRQREEFA